MAASVIYGIRAGHSNLNDMVSGNVARFWQGAGAWTPKARAAPGPWPKIEFINPTTSPDKRGYQKMGISQFYIPRRWVLSEWRKSVGSLANFQVPPKLRRRGGKFKSNMTTVRLDGYYYAL
jgi:hypothetical protein